MRGGLAKMIRNVRNNSILYDRLSSIPGTVSNADLPWPLIVVLVSLSIHLMAQNQLAPSAMGNPTGVVPDNGQPSPTTDDDMRCTMHGRITDAITGTTLAAVKVKVRGQMIAETTTDDTGDYVVKGLPPGRYRIFTEKEGYGGGSADELITIAVGEREQRADFRLYRESVLSGRILGSAGNLVSRAEVVLYVKAFRQGKPQFMSVRITRSDQTGHYRIAGLSAGKYFLGAFLTPKKLEVANVRAPEQAPSTTRTDVPAFYAGTTSLDSASLISLANGQQLESLDVTLVERDVFCAFGATNAANRATTDILINEIGEGWYKMVAFGDVPPGHPFSACGLPPGEYELIERSNDSSGDVTLFGTTEFILHDHDLRLEPVELLPGRPLKGHIHTDPDDATVPSSMRISVEPLNGTFFKGEGATAQIRSPKEFVLENLFSRAYRMRVDLPGGWYVKSTRIDGDVLAKTFQGGTSGDLELTVSANGPTVQGQVVDQENRPIPAATVMLSSDCLLYTSP